MLSLKTLLERQKQKELEKEEKKRIREEKKKEKLRLKKIEHKKKLRQKQNRRAYLKKRQVILDERKKKGDERAYFLVLLCKNRKRIKRIGASWWKTDAYEIYNNAIEENEKTVKFPVKMLTSSNNNKRSDNKRNVKYEIIIVKNVSENDDTTTKFRNDNGKFVDTTITDKPNHIIVAKHEWLVEESFNVYGYHPVKDRKTYDFILNEMVLKDFNDKRDTRRIITFQNKLIIQYIDDFDFVICKNPNECQRLYNQLEKDIKEQKNKYILFMGKLAKTLTTWMLNELENKTGWDRATCKKTTST